MSRRPFGRLLGSYTVNELGDSVGVIALALLVYDGTGDAAATAALFMAAKFVPAFIAPGLTARLDSSTSGARCAMLYLVEALVFAAARLRRRRQIRCSSSSSRLALVDGTLAVTRAGADPRRGRSDPPAAQACSREATGFLTSASRRPSVGGAALAGLLIPQWSLSVALAADAASFLIIALVLGTHSRTSRPTQLERERWSERFRGGLAFARSNPLVRLLLVGEALALIFFTLIIPIEVIYARRASTRRRRLRPARRRLGRGHRPRQPALLVVKSRSARRA